MKEGSREMPRKKHQPPAKIRYDSTHPIISARVDKELKQQLDEIKRMSGKSLGDILREALKVQTPSAKRALTRGKNEGKSKYGISYKCSECKGTMWIDTPEYRGYVTELIEKYGWGHLECKLKPGKILIRGYVPPAY